MIILIFCNDQSINIDHVLSFNIFGFILILIIRC